MKKYNKPTLKSVKINSTHIICASVDSMNMNHSYETQQLSNERGGFFDDEEDLSW